MSDRISRIIQAVGETVWAIEPARGAAMLDVLLFKNAGGRLSDEEKAARLAAEPRYSSARVRAQDGAGTTGGGVAVLSLRGMISHRAAMVDDGSEPAGTSTERFSRRFQDALADEAVGSIVLDVDSPGGTADGVEEMASEILAARGSKPIVAVANTWAGSAAFWIASAADELVVTPSGEVGSIGVFSAHTEISKRQEMEGVKTTLISAGKFKVEGNPFEPLTEEAKAAIQERVNETFDMFVKSVAKGRGVKVSEVRNGFGQGRMVGAKAAVTEGMADRVGTLQDTIARLRGPGPRRQGSARRRSRAFTFT